MSETPPSVPFAPDPSWPEHPRVRFHHTGVPYIEPSELVQSQAFWREIAEMQAASPVRLPGDHTGGV